MSHLKKPGSVGCAGPYDYNCDGRVTCVERYGDGWVWSDKAGGCVYTGSGTPPKVDTPSNSVDVTVGDTTISADQKGWGERVNIFRQSYR